MTEALLTRRVIAYLKQLNNTADPLWFLKIHGGPMQRAGLPDLFVIYKGRTFGIELKRPGKKPTKLQQHTLSEMEKAGATTAVVTSVDQLQGLLERETVKATEATKGQSCEPVT